MSKHSNEEEEKKKNRIVVYIVILIFILLSLITSCSCTSKFFGKIGNLFKNEGTFVLDDTGDQEIIRNQELKFDKDSLEISLSDTKVKLSYTLTNINPDGLTCTTSDAEIATCYVEDGYVVINPKKVGTVTVTLQTSTNGKTYEATATVTITEAKKQIILASKSGTINLYYTNTKKVAYNLVGISGDISVSSSDKTIATATIKNGVIQIKAFKTGKAEITITVNDNGQVYTATYKLTVIKKAPTSGSTGESGSTKPSTGNDNTTGGENESNTKDTNNYLSILSGKKNTSGNTYKLNEEFVKTDSNYTIDVPYNETSIALTATAESSKIQGITYTLINSEYPNGKTLTDLDNIPLASGDNTLKIVVTAENGSTREYTVVIHKPVRTIEIDGDIHNINISDGKYTISYQVLDDDNSVTDYAKDDIELAYEFDGVVTLHKGYITLVPNEGMIDKDGKITLTIKDNKATDNTKVHVNFDYYIGGENQVKKYDVSYFDADDNSKTIIINTNLFSNETNGVDWNYDSDTKILTICSKTNASTCLYITAEGDIDSLAYKSGSGEDSLAIIVNGNINENGEGTGKLSVQGNAYNKEVPEPFDIEVSIHHKFNVTISANPEKYGEDVFFADVERDEFGNIIKLVKKTEVQNDELKNLQVYKEQITGIDKNVLDLANYEAFVPASDSCEYYPVASFNTKSDGTGKSYTINEVISLKNNNLVNNLTLYAIYSDTPVQITGTIEKEAIEYLAFDDDTNISQQLFYNKDFAKYYGNDASNSMKKIIYPGVAGIYDMYFENENDTIKTITGITLEEMDTICVNEKGVKGCLSMAYSVLYNDQAYYGTIDRYEILNNGKKGALANVALPNIVLNGKKTAQDEIGIQLKWKWVEESEKYDTTDALDTLIGNKAAQSSNDNTINDLYKLRVGVKYTTQETQCNK